MIFSFSFIILIFGVMNALELSLVSPCLMILLLVFYFNRQNNAQTTFSECATFSKKDIFFLVSVWFASLYIFVSFIPNKDKIQEEIAYRLDPGYYSYIYRTTLIAPGDDEGGFEGGVIEDYPMPVHVYSLWYVEMMNKIVLFFCFFPLTEMDPYF